jgi:hypothetical protein
MSVKIQTATRMFMIKPTNKQNSMRSPIFFMGFGAVGKGGPLGAGETGDHFLPSEQPKALS